MGHFIGKVYFEILSSNKETKIGVPEQNPKSPAKS
jgi:hypothetical protein